MPLPESLFELSKHKLIIIGEEARSQRISVELLIHVFKQITPLKKVHVVFEQFNFEMAHLIHDFFTKNGSWEHLEEGYKEIGTET